jgi:Holliday junction resolvase RusA-like endonuclease
MIYELTLPLPPSLNQYKKVGRIVKTKSGKLYQQRKNTCHTEKFYFDTYVLHKRSMPAEWLKYARSETIAYELILDMHPHIKIAHKRWDLDNHLKVTLDALVRAKVIYDDSQVIKLVVQKMEKCENGKIIVKIIPLENNQCT